MSDLEILGTSLFSSLQFVKLVIPYMNYLRISN